MRQNVSTLDRVIRAAIGFSILIAGITQAGSISLLLRGAGMLVLFTAISGFSVLYGLIGVSTTREKGAR